MVKTCCACKSRATPFFISKGVKFFRFPAGESYPLKRQAWIRAVRGAIRNKGWTPQEHNAVCSLHFLSGQHSYDEKETDFCPTVFFSQASDKLVNKQTARDARADKREQTSEQREKDKEMEVLMLSTSMEFHDYTCKTAEPSHMMSPDMKGDACMTMKPETSEIGIQCDEDPLIKENQALKLEVQRLQREVQRQQWGPHKIRSSDTITRFYTGLPSFAMFMWLYNYLLPKAVNMTFWNGPSTENRTKEIDNNEMKVSLISQLLSVLMRLRLGLFVNDIANRFEISTATFSKYFSTWVCLLYEELKVLNPFPDSDHIKRNLPSSFRKFPNIRVILDCTEIYVQRSSSLVSQNLTFSNYKHHNTLKFLVGITPSGIISFVSEAWGGRVSDRYITEQCGILDLLKPGDMIMADKGFTISDLLKERKCHLNIPPFRSGKSQFSTEEVFKTKEIAELRIHVERAIGRVKNYHILDGVLPLSIVPIATKIFHVCCWLSNLDVPLVK